VRAEIQEVVARAKRGDAAVVPRLRELLARYPALWEACGDLAAHVELSWVGLAAGDDLRLRESLVLYANKLRGDLTRPCASPAEKLLVDRVVATWLQLSYFSGVEAADLAKGASPRLLEYRGRRQAQAQRLHERAMAALLALQKLLPAPAVIPPAPLSQDVPAEAGRREAAPAERVRLFAEGSEPAEGGADVTPPLEQIRVAVSG
jgi:hypothetical protein